MAKAKKPTKSKPVSKFSFRLKPSVVKFFGLWSLSFMVLMTFFFNSLLDSYNYIEVFPSELKFPILIHILESLIIAGAVYWLPKIKTTLKAYSAKMISVATLSFFFINYDHNLQNLAGPLKAFIPGITDKDPYAFVGVVYFGLIVLISAFIGYWLNNWLQKFDRVKPRDIQLGVLVLAAYLFIIPGFAVAAKMPTMIKESNATAELAKSDNQPAMQSSQDKPDVYYIVLDRYTNANVLKDQFNFDNSDFTNYLRANNFTVNDDAHSNYPYTAMSIASTMNAQYDNKLVEPFKKNKLQSRTLFENSIRQSAVVKALKNSGYKYTALGNWYGTSNQVPLADSGELPQQNLSVFGHTIHLRGIEISEFEKSPFHQLALLEKTKWWPFKYIPYDNQKLLHDQLTSLDNIADQKPGGRFIFAHILMPHDPFIFNADGSTNPYQNTDSYGLPIKKKYTNQIEFINSQMKELVDRINKNSEGKSVILINADEGSWPQYMNDSLKNPQAVSDSHTEAIFKDEDMTKWSDDWLQMKFGILQAVHIPNANNDDLNNLSSVNLFRIILNRYAGYNLSYLPNCQFGLTDGSLKEYLHADITSRLNPQADPACKTFQSAQ